MAPYSALLLQPPPGDVTGPYPALAYLKSYAAGHGYRVRVKDLGIEALHYLTHPDRVAGMLALARERCDRLEASPRLDPYGQQCYGRLLAALAIDPHPEWFAEAFRRFREPEAFFDYRQYKTARNALNAFFDILSALHDPTVLTAATYPTATALKTMEKILAHQQAALNPYILYYEAVLFPLIAAERPSLVGISMVFANQSVQALVLGRMIKARFPGIHVALGGAYLSQWAMTTGDPQVAALLTCADTIVCGEGEDAFIDLLARVLAGDTPAGRPNLISPDGTTRAPVRFDRLQYTDIAAQPPPDFSDLDLGAYLAPRTIIPYCVSRGCYWGRCVFCQNRYGDHRPRRYQTVPVDKAVAEMGLLADRYGSDHFNFSNDVVDPAYLKKLSRALLKSGRRIRWNTDLRAENALDAGTCRLMANAGLTSVAIGFESGCQKTLDAMDKGTDVAVIAEVMKNLTAAGVATQAMGIFGMPGESEADGEKTVHFLETHTGQISYYVMGLMMVLPGSRMHSDPAAHGVSAVSYGQNPLKTPEPVWWSATRMSLESVNRLYARLSRLEEIYAIDEYPYVGGLSTNHGFLYYTLGPDILKCLRRDETAALDRWNRRLRPEAITKKRRNDKKDIPRLVLPHHVHRSRFPLHRFVTEPDESPGAPTFVPGPAQTFLIFTGSFPQTPVPVDRREIALLNRIDGRRPLASVLKKTDPAELARTREFLWLLVQFEAIEFVPVPE